MNNYFKQRMAILDTYKRAILNQYPNTPKDSGIYFLTRKKDDKNCIYIGQSIHILQRIAEHIFDHKGYIDNSLKEHGLKTLLNPKGWKLDFIECDKTELDFLEKKYIAEYQIKGWKVYNKTSGGQGVGKEKIAEFKEPKGYRKGTEYGYKKAQKEIAKLFEKNLKAEIQGSSNKLKERAMEKFNLFLKID